MKDYNQDYIPGQWGTGPQPAASKEVKPVKRGVSIGFLLSAVCIVAVFAILFTYTMTAEMHRKYYSNKLAEQQAMIEQLQNGNRWQSDLDLEKLEMIADLIEEYSYYAGAVGEEDLLTAVLKAYVEATGDRYAEYYTEEEYKEIYQQNQGDYEGIGVSVIQTVATVEGYEYMVFQIIAVYEGSPAEDAGICVGDLLYAVKAEDTYQTVSELGGYTQALQLIRGKKGTQAEVAVFRPHGETFESLTYSITRDAYESQSVSYLFSEKDPKVGIVRISSFDLTTPSQFKTAVNRLLAGGAEHFVFDVRNNPGGDLQSIKAVLTYFLQEGDLILKSIDRNGKVAKQYFATPIDELDEYAACNVAKEEIGMFADLDITVICNENTASAAEVFTATMRDYELATVVGETTFGKGIMQSTLPLSFFGEQYTGYLKMTTYAYVTACGVTYHEIGVKPDVEVSLSSEAQNYNIYVLPQELDDQLQAAIAQFK